LPCPAIPRGSQLHLRKNEGEVHRPMNMPLADLSQVPVRFEPYTSPDLESSSTAGRRLSTRLRGGWENHNATDSYWIPESRQLTGDWMPSLPTARMVRPGVSRSSSAGLLLYLPPAPVPSGRRKKAAFLLQRASETFPGEPLPSPVPELFFPVAGDTLQT